MYHNKISNFNLLSLCYIPTYSDIVPTAYTLKSYNILFFDARVGVNGEIARRKKIIGGEIFLGRIEKCPFTVWRRRPCEKVNIK